MNSPNFNKVKVSKVKQVNNCVDIIYFNTNKLVSRDLFWLVEHTGTFQEYLKQRKLCFASLIVVYVFMRSISDMFPMILITVWCSLCISSHRVCTDATTGGRSVPTVRSNQTPEFKLEAERWVSVIFNVYVWWQMIFSAHTEFLLLCDSTYKEFSPLWKFLMFYCFPIDLWWLFWKGLFLLTIMCETD